MRARSSAPLQCTYCNLWLAPERFPARYRGARKTHYCYECLKPQAYLARKIATVMVLRGT